MFYVWCVMLVYFKLVELGFLDYVRDVLVFGYVYLFFGLSWVDLGLGNQVSGWFNCMYFCQYCGIVSKIKIFYGFWYMFVILVDCFGVFEVCISQFMGYCIGFFIVQWYYIKLVEVWEMKIFME